MDELVQVRAGFAMADEVAVTKERGQRYLRKVGNVHGTDGVEDAG